MTSNSFVVQIPTCCERLGFLIDSLNQAKNLNLSHFYITELQEVILEMMGLQHDALIEKYDYEIENILSLRNEAFETYKDSLKNKFQPIPKTEILN